MEYKDLKTIIKDMEESKLEELNIEFPDGTKIEMKKHIGPKGGHMMPPPPMGFMGQMPMMGSQGPVPVNNVPELKKEDISASGKEEENYKLVKSPMVGTFYSKPSPKAEAFVKVGDKVKKGDVLCIVEAMKLMNEVESEFDGEVVEVCCKDDEMVEYGQTLIKIK